jgi:hypothetical protein
MAATGEEVLIMRIPRLRISIAAVLAVAAVAAGATTSVALGSRTGTSPIEQAATKSGKASTFKFDFTLSISGGGSSIPGGKITLSGSGAANTPHKLAAVKLDLSSIAPLLGSATQGAVPKSIALVVVGNTVYLNFPALAKQAGAPGKQWVKFDLTKLPKSKTGGVDPKAVGSVSPQQALGALRSALKVHKVGSDTHGTHYHATLDLSSLVAVLPKAQQASSSASLAKAGIKSVPLDVWVGPSGYVTRFVTSLNVKAQKSSPAASITLTLNIHDYNHKVNITAPPAGQTADGNKLLTGLLGSLPGG